MYGGRGGGLKTTCRYAPALRPLRQIAKVFQFGKVSATRLSDRVMQVAQLEHITTDSRAVTALCELADFDIRSCLNTLQFLHGQYTREQKRNSTQSSSKKRRGDTSQVCLCVEANDRWYC
jgi:DNA polymerase III delta prime subunit